jgi:DNA-directed RNA polymerase specialized sigma24 family protein
MAVNRAMAEVQEFPNSASSRQRWTLTKEAFDKLLTHLDAEPDLAGEKYLVIRRNLVRFFEGRGCPFAEDHADEVINRLAKRCGEGEVIQDIDGYCYGVARLLLLEIFKEQTRQASALRDAQRDLPLLEWTHSNAEQLDRANARLECLTSCLEKLSPDGRKLVVDYYEGDKQSRIENRKRLTESLGIPNQALRSRALRLRDKLETCISSCLKSNNRRHRSAVSTTNNQRGN